MDFGLDGTVALITGGASGIGRGIAEAFGRAGARVVLTYLSSTEGAASTTAAVEAARGHAVALQADLTMDGEAERVVKQTIEYFGSVDVLITNAGGLLQRSPVVDTPRELWERALAVNLTSTFLCCRAVLPHMQRAGRGCIITISSLAAHDGGSQGASHYAAAKGGVLSFTRALA